MPNLDLDKWPLVYQILAGVGALATGAYLWLRGVRSKDAGESPERLQDKLDDANLRRDLEAVVSASRTGAQNEMNVMRREIEAELGSLDNRIRILEISDARRGAFGTMDSPKR